MRLLTRTRDLCAIYGMSTLAVEAAQIVASSTGEGLQLNALNAEALAVAAHLGARVVVTAHYPALEAAAEHLGIEVRTLGP